MSPFPHVSAGRSFGNRSNIGLSEHRIAENEAVFRDSNRRLDERYQELGIVAERIPFLCECGNERCTQVITLTPGEYAQIRAHPSYFLLVPGHQILASETVIAEHDGYTVVEKGSSVLRTVEEVEEALFRE